jgi:hypothetical protein
MVPLMLILPSTIGQLTVGPFSAIEQRAIKVDSTTFGHSDTLFVQSYRQ